MPNRVLKESVCYSDNLNRLTLFQENMFFRLIVNCDDYGLMDSRPAVVKAKLYPLKDYRIDQISDGLRALSSAELVDFYEVNGLPFLQMRTWQNHQQVRAHKAKYPAPPWGLNGKKDRDEIICNQMLSDDSRCNQMLSDDSTCSRNPIQSESESESESNRNPSDSCAELSQASAPVAKLPLVDGTEYTITEKDAEEDGKAYPAVDVKQEYLRMQRWLESNPKNKKTKKGIRRFINNWLARSQDSARPSARQKTVSAQAYGQREYTEAQLNAVSADLFAEAKAFKG